MSKDQRPKTSAASLRGASSSASAKIASKKPIAALAQKKTASDAVSAKPAIKTETKTKGAKRTLRSVELGSAKGAPKVPGGGLPPATPGQGSWDTLSSNPAGSPLDLFAPKNGTEGNPEPIEAADFSVSALNKRSAAEAMAWLVEEGVTRESASALAIDSAEPAKATTPGEELSWVPSSQRPSIDTASDSVAVDPAPKSATDQGPVSFLERTLAGPAPRTLSAREDNERRAKAAWALKATEQQAMLERRALEAEDALRSSEQDTYAQETAVWMRKGGAILVGLNLVTVLAVFVLGRVHVSQLKEMQRATAASGEAAYAACLGTQTERNLLLQMKAEESGLHASASEVPGLTPASLSAHSALMSFDLEKNTNLDVHVPVLYHFAVQNTGDSPALHAKIWGAVKVLPVGMEPDFRYDDVALTENSIRPRGPVARVITYTEDAGRAVPLSDTDLKRVKSGSAYVVAYGRVAYEDLNGVRRWAEFCQPITAANGAQSQLNKCKAYNGSGELNGAESAPNLLNAADQHLATPAAQTAALHLPEIACELPKPQRN